MRKRIAIYLGGAALLATLAVCAAGDTGFTNVVATGDLTAGDDVIVGDDLTVAGLTTIGETLAMTGDLTLSGGAGALTFSGTASTIVVDDGDATALLIGSSGALNLLTINTGTATESVIITGTTTVKAFQVTTGVSDFDEAVNVDGILTAGAGAGALTFDDTASSIVVLDNDATALDIGSSGNTSFLRVDTTTNQETLIIDGTTDVLAFHVDDGLATFDNDVSIGGGAGALTLSGSGDSSMLLADNDSTAFVVGSATDPSILTIDTGDDTESVIITGYAAAQSFHVDVGTSTFDEAVSCGASIAVTTTSDLNGDISAGGGAGALTFDGTSDSIVTTDDAALGLLIGSAGHTNLATFDTTNDQETLIITGETSVDAFHVDVGTSQFDENADFGAGIDVTGDTTSTGKFDGTNLYTDLVEISNAELVDLAANEKTLVAAQGASTIIEVVGIVWHLDYGSAVCTESDDDLDVKYVDNGGTAITANIETTASWLVAGADAWGWTQPLATLLTGSDAEVENVPVILDNDGDGEFGGCTGSTIDVWITYRVHTAP